MYAGNKKYRRINNNFKYSKTFLKNVSYPSILMPINQAWSTKCTEKKSEEGLITKDGPKKNQKQIETRWK